MDKQTASDMDGGWKQIIDDFLEEFFLFYFPTIHALIDFTKRCRLLDKELASIMAGAAIGRREADKLLEVHWKSGGRDLLLVHVEVQAQQDPYFPERMFIYNTRIRAKYGRPAASMALLIDDAPSFRPNRWYSEVAGCVLSFQYPIVKLINFKTEVQLLADPSPFAIASLVQLRKLKARGNTQHTFHYKVELANELVRRNYPPQYVLKLFRFIEYIMKLPKTLDDQYKAEIQKTEEKSSMVYLASFERKALEQGIEQGIDQGRRKGLINALHQTLEIRFGEIPQSLLDRIEHTESIAELEALHRQALTAQSIDNLE